MGSILERIVESKRGQIAAARSLVPEEVLRQRSSSLPPARDFRGALERSSGIGIIAEVKKASPSAGVIRADFDPVSIAQIYDRHRADCLSVLTDEPFFQGKLEYMTAVREAVTRPVLRKDFIIDSYQLLEARAAGADAVLLIAEILPENKLDTLFRQASELGLQVLVELYDRENLPRVLATGARLIGVNNRDLRSFVTRLEHTLDLVCDVPGDVCLVSESGIRTRADVERLEEAGVRAILVGETLMRAADIGAKLDELRGV